jgi:glutamate-5-semialdehyde dehydrogenase
MPDSNVTETNAVAAMSEMARQARAGQRALAQADAATRTRAIAGIAVEIEKAKTEILAANAEDVQAAEANDLGAAKIDRLKLDEKRLAGVAEAARAVAAQDDPVGGEIAHWSVKSGLKIARVRTPIGVIGMIYESRPNVTVDAAALCLRSGNAVILRGGSDAARSNAALHACVQRALKAADLPEACVQLASPSRAAADALLGSLDIDLIIPRGGKSLVERVQQVAKAPVLAHLEGNCHLYIHADADPSMARSIALNAKMRRTGVCGAAETLLIDRSVAETLLPGIAQDLIAAGCALRGDPTARALVKAMTPATDEDWRTEFLDAILAVRVVDGLEQAIDHIGLYGSSHTESIVTEDAAAAERFLNAVDSAIVMHNASTQFADGGEFGMGAEIGISTNRLHARGPVGAEQLTTFKYQVRGAGQTRP